MTTALGVAGAWLPVRDGDPRALALYLRHYSATKNRRGQRPQTGNQRRFAGIGEHMVLLTPTADALFVWRRERYRLDGQTGVNCSVFRNEGPHLASLLYQEACEMAWHRWPDQRLFTYVNPRRIRSANPGYCFKRAGWRLCGESAKGLLILERMP